MHTGKISCIPSLPERLDTQVFSEGCVREHLLLGLIIFIAFLSQVFSGWRLDWHCDPRFAGMIISCRSPWP